MKIPVNLPDRNDVIIHVIKTYDNNYSAAVAEIVNGYGLNPLSNLIPFGEKQYEDPCDPISMFNPIIKDKRLSPVIRENAYDAIKDCMTELYQLYNLKV